MEKTMTSRTTARTAGVAASISAAFLCAAVLQAADAPDLRLVAAPPMGTAETGKATELGEWDDVFAPKGQDFLIVRRGEEVFSLSMLPGAGLKKLVKMPKVQSSTIVASAQVKDKLWLFFQSEKTSPFVLEAFSGKVAELEVPGLALPGEHAPSIQSHVIVPHVGGAVLMVTGGDAKTWPRPVNRPVCFWVSLDSGRTIRFPIGWDFDYCSADQATAVFQLPQERPDAWGPKKAIDMATGGTLDKVPDRREAYIPHEWPETVRPLYVRRAETGDRDHFTGLSVEGRSYRFDLPLTGVYYLQDGKVGDGFVGFRLRKEGATSGPNPLWLCQLAAKPQAIHALNEVAEFEMLRRGKCIVQASVKKPRGVSGSALVYDYSKKAAWNLLDGVEQLPPLDPQFVGKGSVVDNTTVRLIGSFGSEARDPMVLCLFYRIQGDLRSFREFERPLVATKTWRRAVLLSGDGNRSMTELYRERDVPTRIWLHNSGKLIEAVSNGEKECLLREVTLSGKR
jgi:hypothetical protein